jgi:hypothetical protein
MAEQVEPFDSETSTNCLDVRQVVLDREGSCGRGTTDPALVEGDPAQVGIQAFRNRLQVVGTPGAPVEQHNGLPGVTLGAHRNRRTVGRDVEGPGFGSAA